MEVYTKPSILLAAVFPAITTEPNELMEDCISTLEILKITPCKPAGSPTRNIPNSLSLWKDNSFSRKCKTPSDFSKLSNIKPADIACAIIVASATPATPICKTMTKNKLKITLTTPATVKK